MQYQLHTNLGMKKLRFPNLGVTGSKNSSGPFSHIPVLHGTGASLHNERIFMRLSAAKRTRRASLMEETSNPLGRANIHKVAFAAFCIFTWLPYGFGRRVGRTPWMARIYPVGEESSYINRKCIRPQYIIQKWLTTSMFWCGIPMMSMPYSVMV